MQLEFDLLTAPKSQPPRITVTRPLRDHRRCNSVLTRVDYVRRFFPELDGATVKVGLTRAASGMAIMGGNEIWLNPAHASFHTIAHEFVHLLQTRDLGIPQGERSCDVFSLARHWTLNDVPPSYVRVPSTVVSLDGSLSHVGARLTYDAAAEAVSRREGGLRRYIAFFETRLHALAESSALPLVVGVLNETSP